ncbi:hypothetical protein HDU87_008084 [Geranomyces variabilis]|uniref:Uncharacterized protein n=1 Tax=Geranomyces variabilis TaxID=109894 RepID=A0AAD5TPR4_9FUNG|nr:hypothetical protein HDU87_008084 [Geranomyces variabilis]
MSLARPPPQRLQLQLLLIAVLAAGLAAAQSLCAPHTVAINDTCSSIASSRHINVATLDSHCGRCCRDLHAFVGKRICVSPGALAQLSAVKPASASAAQQQQSYRHNTTSAPVAVHLTRRQSVDNSVYSCFFPVSAGGDVGDDAGELALFPDDDDEDYLEEIDSDENYDWQQSAVTLEAADLASIAGLDLNSAFNPTAVMSNADSYKGTDTSKFPDLIALAIGAASTIGDTRLWTHQRLQLTWLYLRNVWNDIETFWSDPKQQHEVYQGKVRDRMLSDANAQYLTWLQANFQTYFKCNIKCIPDPIRGQMPRIPVTFTFLPGQDGKFYADVQAKLGLSQSQMIVGDYNLYTAFGQAHPTVVGSGAGEPLVVKNLPVPDSTKYPPYFLPVIQKFMATTPPNAADGDRIAGYGQLDPYGDDVGTLGTYTNQMMVAVSNMADLYNSWRAAQQEVFVVEKEISDDVKNLLKEIFLGIGLLIGGEALAPFLGPLGAIIEGSVDIGSLAARAAEFLGGGTDIDVTTSDALQAIEDATSDSDLTEALNALRNSPKWRDSAPVKAFEKAEKAFNDPLVKDACLAIKKGWEIGQYMMPDASSFSAFTAIRPAASPRKSGSSRHVPSRPSNSTTASLHLRALTIPVPRALASPESRSPSPWSLSGLYARFASLFERGKRNNAVGPEAVKNLLQLAFEADSTTASRKFCLAGDATGKQYADNCRDKFGFKKGTDTGNHAYLPNPAMDGTSTRQSGTQILADTKARSKITGAGTVMNADHGVEKGWAVGVLTLMGKALMGTGTKGSKKDYDADIIDALGSYDPADASKNYALQLRDLIHGQNNMWYIDGPTNQLKKELVTKGFQKSSYTPEVGAIATNGNKPVMDNLFNYLKDMGSTFEATAENLAKLNEAAMDALRGIDGLAKEDYFIQLDKDMKAQNAAVRLTYKADGGWLKKNIDTFRANPDFNKLPMGKTALLALQEGSNSHTDAYNLSKDEDIATLACSKPPKNKDPNCYANELKKVRDKRAAKEADRAAKDAAKRKADDDAADAVTKGKAKKSKQAQCGA